MFKDKKSKFAAIKRKADYIQFITKNPIKRNKNYKKRDPSNKTET